jgi:hypothetical protein
MSNSLLSREAMRAYQMALIARVPFDPTPYVSPESIDITPSIDSPHSITLDQSQIDSAGRESWRVLFTSVESIEDLIEWEKTIPRYCECEPFYLAWKKENPPGNSIDFEWKYRLKSAVNAKLGRPNITLEEARAEWLNKKSPLDDSKGDQ